MVLENPSFEDAGSSPGEAAHWTLTAVTSLEVLAGFGGQLAWTLVHGVLHLVGYDHEKDDGEMRRRERVLLKDLKPLVQAFSAEDG